MPTILLVMGQKEARNRIKKQLETDGHLTLVAGSCDEAIAFISDSRRHEVRMASTFAADEKDSRLIREKYLVDLVIYDDYLPDTSSDDFSDTVLRRHRSIKMVLFANNTLIVRLNGVKAVCRLSGERSLQTALTAAMQ